MRSIAVVCSAVIGVAFLMSPAFAQEKTAKACQAEWRANKADNQAKGITEKAYVAKCRGGDSAAKPAPAPAASTAKEKKEKKTTAAAAPAATEKTAKACRDEWRANKADNQAKGITEKAYVTQCRAGTAAAQPAPAPARKRRRPRRLRRLLLRKRRRPQHPRRRLHPRPKRRRRPLPWHRRPPRRRQPASTSTRPKRKPSRAAGPERLCGPTWIRRSITSRLTRITATRNPARTCASGMRPARECAPPRTRNIPERLMAHPWLTLWRTKWDYWIS